MAVMSYSSRYWGDMKNRITSYGLAYLVKIISFRITISYNL